MSSYSNPSVTDKTLPSSSSSPGSKGYFGNFISCFPQQALSSQQGVSLIKLPKCIHSVTAKGALQNSQSHEQCSSHMYLRLLHSQVDPLTAAGYMQLHKHLPETWQDTSSREFEDKLPVPLPSSTTIPRVSLSH